MGQSDEVRRQFGPVASAYVSSSFHAHGPDLARLVAEAGFTGTEVVLDLGCGAGHTALACANHAARVVGVDVTPEMVGVASCTARADEAELPLGWIIARLSTFRWPWSAPPGAANGWSRKAVRSRSAHL